jgi:DNA polymerase I-like protein with 3'-5' exonuclease and polymerase domains
MATQHIITLDFETFYDTKFSLSRLTTEEYVRDNQFDIIGVGIKIDTEPAYWVSGPSDLLNKHLLSLPWKNSSLLCHNTMFDGAILAWSLKIQPRLYLDTLSMARAVHGVDVGGSLAKLATRYQIGEKGDEVVNAKGKRKVDFSPEELERYGEYCKNDVELTYQLFGKMVGKFQQNEINLIDLTLRMFIHPMFYVDDDLLHERLQDLRDEKFNLLGSLKEKLNCANEEEVRKKLASNTKFAETLKELGVEPPTKTSLRTGKEAYALAKNDEGFIELTESEDTFIQHLCAVRLGTKSTIEESRIERFIEIGRRNKSRLPIPLKYYGAHTGRWAGSDKVNFQNLPSRDKKKKTLKNAVIAPEGYMVINCDSSQIEARVLAWLAGQDDVVKAFAEGRDVYSEFATKIYNKPISKENPIERFVGKTCILGLGYGTGAKKLQHTLKTQPPGAVITEEQAKDYVGIYRKENDKIIALWSECDKYLEKLIDWPNNEDGTPAVDYFLGKQSCVSATPEGILLPNNFFIHYPDIKNVTDEDEKSRIVYQSRKGEASIWGGSVVENVVQALARCVIGEQMLLIAERYRPALTVHDAVVCVVPEDEVEEANDFIIKCMNTRPKWASGLPITCESSYGRSYGEC